jgi:hypothetical protein
LDNVRAEDAKEMFVGALVLEDLIRSRSSFRRPTVVTSRMDENELALALPGFDEIAQASCVYLEVTGEDLRKVKQITLKGRLGVAVGK